MIATEWSESMDSILVEFKKFFEIDFSFTSYEQSDVYYEDRFKRIKDKQFIESEENHLELRLMNKPIVCVHCFDKTYLQAKDQISGKWDSYYCRHCDSFSDEED